MNKEKILLWIGFISIVAIALYVFSLVHGKYCLFGAYDHICL